MIRERYAHPRFALVPLGSLTKVVQYGTSRRCTSEPGGVPVLRIPNLQIDGWDLSDLKYLRLTPGELSTYRLEKGDILFNRTNGSRELVGKCEVFNFDGDWVFASYLIRLRIDSAQALPEFVTSFLNTFWGRRQVEHVSRQILMSNINTEEIRALKIPLPKPPKQRELLSALNAARAAQRSKLAQAEALLADLDSFVLGTLGLTLPSLDGNRTTYAVRSRDVVAANKLHPDYFHPERINAIRAVQSRYMGERATTLVGIANFVRDQEVVGPREDYLGLANVQPNTGERIDSTEEAGEGNCFVYAEGDVLFARLRPYLNKVYRAESDGVCSTEFHVIRVRRDEKGELRLIPDYLAAVMRSKIVLAQTRHLMTGNTHPRLSNEDVVNLVVPVPERAVQEKIADEVARRRKEARRLREEAPTLWNDAKRRFEDELLGPETSAEISRMRNARFEREQ
jgi:type I restriction enzyme S subunit